MDAAKKQELLNMLKRAGSECRSLFDRIKRVSLNDEQRKLIKYNHLVANLLSFHTLVTMSSTLKQLQQEGTVINKEAIERLSPYRTGHIKRFGNYEINLNRSFQTMCEFYTNPYRLPTCHKEVEVAINVVTLF